MPFDGCHVRYCRRASSRQTIPTPGACGLSEGERAQLSRMRDAAARERWLHARLCAKEFLAELLERPGLDHSRLEIASRDGQGRGQRPQVRLDGELVPVSLSISHTDRGVIVAVADQPGVIVGVDLTPVEPRGRGFVELWFTPREQARLRSGNPRDAAIAWAMKEAVYKATQEGEGFSPRTIEIVADGDRWTAWRGGAERLDDVTIRTWIEDDHAAALAVQSSTQPKVGFERRLLAARRD